MTSALPLVADLLHAAPREAPGQATVERLLDFCFASGGSAVGLEHRLRTSASAVPFAAAAEDLFLSELCAFLSARCAPALDAEGLLAALSAGVGPEDREVRHAAFQVLFEHPTLARELTGFHRELRRLVDLLSGASLAGKLDARTRRLDALRQTRVVLEALAAFPPVVGTLGHLRALGEAVTSSEAFARLAALLDYEEQAATLDVRIGLGADGSVRRFDLLRVQEAEQNPFHMSALRRWVQIVSLWLRGQSVRQADVLERAVDAVFSGVLRPLACVLFLLPQVEFYLAGLALSAAAAERGLEAALPRFVEHGASREYRGLFNPLLLATPDRVVSLDLSLTGEQRLVVLTGPNSGGKTRVLQALGLTQWLAQAGFPVPAALAALEPAPTLQASLVEQPSATQREGRLGVELLRIREVFETLRPGGFLAIDELCSGTHPAEAEGLLRMVLELLVQLRPQAFVTTHFLELAAALQGEPLARHLAFFRVELDEAGRPTYRLVPGVADSSLARETAARLGVTRAELEALVARHRA